MQEHKLTPVQARRYSRHVLLPQVGEEGQARLLESRVLVVGLGGLGSPAALYLAAAGVGTIGLADFDKVEVHNLQRQIIHGEGDVGRPKVDSAAERLRALDPAVRLEVHREGVTTANAVSLFSGYDVIVDCTDNFPVRYRNADAAFFARKPLVYGSISQFEGQVSVFDPASGGPCYRCLFPRMPEPGTVPNCAEAGVLGAICGVVGSMQAMEAVKVLLGIGEPLRGRMLVYDALRARVATVALAKDVACPLCGASPAIGDLREANYEWSCAPRPTDGAGDGPAEIGAAEAAQWIAGASAPFVLDVRQPHEARICALPGSHLVPLDTIEARWRALPRDRAILVYCHHGMRSMKAARFLVAKGFGNVTNLRGGIDAWATDVDAAMARY